MPLLDMDNIKAFELHLIPTPCLVLFIVYHIVCVWVGGGEGGLVFVV